MSIYENVKKVLQDVVVPEIRGIQVEIKRLDDKMGALDEKFDNKIDSSRNEMRSEFKRIEAVEGKLSDKIDSLDKKFDDKIDSLDKKFDDKIGALDEKFDSRMGALEEKFDDKIGSLSDVMRSEFERVDDRIESLNQRLGVALEVRERLAALEAKVGSIPT